jgi:thiamine-phosphate pyrophosphorylase
MNELKKRNINVPVIAIGGIQLVDISPLMNTGIEGVAVSSAISHHENPRQITESLLNKIY